MQPTEHALGSATAPTRTGLREQILGADDIVCDTVTIPEWQGATLIIRSGTGTQRAKLLDAAVVPGKDGGESKVDLERIYPDLVIHSACDPSSFNVPFGEAGFDPASGEQIFSITDRDALMTKNGAAIERVSKVAMRLWGLDDASSKEAEGNSNGTPSDASTTSS